MRRRAFRVSSTLLNFLKNMQTFTERPGVHEPAIEPFELKPERKRSGFSIEQLLWLIVAIGIVPRLSLFLANHSLWLDEAMLALNITHRPLAQLTLPLDWNQAAPVGYLFLVKLSEMTFGNSEYAVRLVSIFSGIASLVAFRWLALKSLSKMGAVIAMMLFAVSPSLCDYSAQAKQYESDVLVALILSLYAINLIPKAIKPVTAILWGALGAFAVWFSFPSLFVLGGQGLTAAMTAVRRRDHKSLTLLSIPFGMWLASFSVYYTSLLATSANNKFFNQYWKKDFIPWSLEDCPHWFSNKLVETIHSCFGIAEIIVGVAALCMVVGSFHMLKRRQTEFLIAIAPIMMALLAALVHVYPIKPRLITFVVPGLIILVAAGIERISQGFDRRKLVVATCLTGLFVSSMMYSMRPSKQEEMRPLVQYIQKHGKPTDTIYLYYGSVPAFQYYAELYNLPQNNVILGISYPNFQQYYKGRTPGPTKGAASLGNWINGETAQDGRNWNYRYKTDILALAKSDRVWAIFSHPMDKRPHDQESLALYYLDEIGTKVREVSKRGAHAYLYDMNQKPGSPNHEAIESAASEDQTQDSARDASDDEELQDKGNL